MDNMEQLTCEIRYSQDDTRQTPGRVTGTLIVFEKRAGDRPELFERDSIHWPELGIVINEMHQRNAPVLRVIPFLDGDELRIDGVLPDTQRGRDAATNIREHVYTGLILGIQGGARTSARGHPVYSKGLCSTGGAGGLSQL